MGKIRGKYKAVLKRWQYNEFFFWNEWDHDVNWSWYQNFLLISISVAYVKKNYKDKSIKVSIKITKDNEKLNYDSKVNGKILIFYKNGNFFEKRKVKN